MMTARQARKIRRRCQRNSQCHDSWGISELFLAPPDDSKAILETKDLRLKYWLLGFRNIPASVLAAFRRHGWSWLEAI
ncbi:MAG: hypothetical protein ACE5E5_04860 [Phycisphaerae bacterium]